VLGDYVPFGAGQVLDVPVSSISLDNTIRFADLSPTEWILLDIRIDNVAGGYAHGNVHLWTDSGELMATASQTAQLRRWRD
jgi:acyl-CoA thioesterase-2